MIQKVFFRIFSWDNSFVNYAIQLTESKAILECRASKESPPLFFTSLIFNRILHAFLSSKIFFRSAGLIEMFAITFKKKKKLQNDNILKNWKFIFNYLNFLILLSTIFFLFFLTFTVHNWIVRSGSYNKSQTSFTAWSTLPICK